MKAQSTYLFSFVMVVMLLASSVHAQQRDIDNFRNPDKSGLNVFEAPKTDNVTFDGIYVRVGGANTLQFQALRHDNTLGTLPDLESNFNLATSNLDLDVVLAKGLRMHLRTYLSSQHHAEAWVKGGYFQVDGLDFIQEGLLSGLMENLRIKVGHMENNYGDTHFRRSDNGAALHNPFVGNYIMDSFTTEVGAEVYYLTDGFFGMIGLTNGKLNQSSLEPAIEEKVKLYLKLGYDSQINEDLRFRLSGSLMNGPEAGSQYLYSGDRGGSRYYNVLDDDFRSGRFSPDFVVSRFAPGGPIGGELRAIMINPFVKFQGLEFFGVLEMVSGKRAVEADNRSFNQYGAELIYRFGDNEDVYVGGRYNMVSGELASGADISIDRINVGGGWFLTPNVLTKFEYVQQTYNDYPAGSKYDGGEFNGFVIEAVISF